MCDIYINEGQRKQLDLSFSWIYHNANSDNDSGSTSHRGTYKPIIFHWWQPES